MRAKAGRQNNAVLPSSREERTPKAGSLGLFGAAGISRNGRSRSPKSQEVSDSGSGDGNVRAEILRLMKLPANQVKEIDPETMSAGEVLARVLLSKAIFDEHQNAIEAVLDRIEGKPTKAAANKPNNDSLLDQLDVSLKELDELVPEK